ncbi:hypothetical protein SAMN05421736_10585 [Evansella caseinilytica]|uniref:Uncharacterized protein n=1 Tax=Evansella caseinilytica TaxID=1503961 RepID=A0A1H3PJZ7_9BACI|nr:hypothetical protein [Evansella caseinilytica]SDZ01464.1 hypothetical protein SAMN05421736_10585 [Evansella caseinilytica]
MLKVTITYTSPKMLYGHFSSLGFRYENNSYTLLSATRRDPLVTVTHLPDQKKVILAFPEDVTMEECEKIHNLIASTHSFMNGRLDDETAHIGYDERGKKVFIYRGFKAWFEYISAAKHKSMEGQLVAVFHGDERLGEGILLTYHKEAATGNGNAENAPAVSCTIVTTTGEQRFFGDNLSLVPKV